jgi:hypothetical protein
MLSGCATIKHDATSQNSFIQTCERLVNHYPIPRDSLDGYAYGKMFTEDAEFILRGKITKGRQRIVEDLVTRASKTSTRHVTGSVNVTRLSSTLGTGISYALVFSSDRKVETQPRELNERSLMAVVSYLDKFKFENGECFFSQREVVVDFLNTIKK